LGLFFIVSFIAKILVGAAGHSGQKDYFLFVFIIITVALLTVFHRLDKRKTLKRKSVRLSLIILVLTSVVFAIYFLYDIFLNKYFSFGDNVTTAIIILFILLGSTLLVGLIKDRE
jgi:amino acid transporter